MKSTGRRTSLVTIDQGLSSASNFLVLILVAHTLGPVDFGRFSLLFLVYAATQALTRSLISVPVLIHPTDADERPRAALGAALILGFGSGVVVAAAGAAMWALDSVMAPSVLVMGGVLAFLLAHDVGRYLAFARHHPGQAIVLDVLWIVLIVAGFALARRYGATDLTWLVLAWGGAGAVASLWALVQYGVPRGKDLSLGWVREKWSFAWRSLLGTVGTQAVGLFGAGLAALVGSPVAVAALRASLLVGRPSATVQLGIGASTAADVAREEPEDGGLRLLRRALAICLAVALVNMAVLFLVPDVAGRAVLGEVWTLVEPLLLPVGLFGIAAAVQTAAQGVLLGRHEMSLVMRVDVTGAIVAVVCIVTGAAVGDAAGALWGTLTGQTIVAVAYMFAFRSSRRRHLRPGRHRGPRRRRRRHRGRH